MTAQQRAVVDDLGNIAVHGRAGLVAILKVETATEGVYADISDSLLYFEVAGKYRIELAAGDTVYERKIIATRAQIDDLAVNQPYQFAVHDETPTVQRTLWSGTITAFGFRTAPTGASIPTGEGAVVSGATVIVRSAGTNDPVVIVRYEGTTGAAGPGTMSGAGAPADATGTNGELYIDTTNNRLYGPRTSGAWVADVWRNAATGGTAPDADAVGTADHKVMSVAVRYAVSALSSVKLLYPNFQITGSGDSSTGTGALAITCSISYPTVADVIGTGSCTATAGASGTTAAITLSTAIPAGAKFFVSTFATPASGTGVPAQRLSGVLGVANTALGEACVRSAAATDLTADPETVVDTAAAMYGPAAVMALVDGSVPAVAIVCDSIGRGQGSTFDAYNNSGFVAKGLGVDVASLNMSRGGMTAAYTASAASMRQALAVAAGCTHAVTNLGTVDAAGSATAAAIKASLDTVWAAWRALGMDVRQATLVPRSSSTDGWVTTANQTASALMSVITPVNTYIRMIPAPLSACIEVSDEVSSYRDTGIWLANLTEDGVHPADAGTALMAVSVAALDWPCGFIPLRGYQGPKGPPGPASTATGTVSSVAALTLGTTGTDLSSTVANGTTTPVITLNVPTASASNRGALSAADWSAFNAKQAAISFGTGVLTFLGTPTSANLLAAVTDETGTGSLVFATSPTLVTPTLGVATATSLAVGAGAEATPALSLNGTSTGFSIDSSLSSELVDSGDLVLNAGLSLLKRGSSNSLRPRWTSEGNLNHILQTYGTGAPSLTYRKARGSIATPALISTNDVLGQFLTFGYNGSAFAATGRWTFSIVAATPSATDMESRWTLRLVAPATASESDILSLRWSTGLTAMGGVVIDQNRHHQLRSYTVATLPSAATAGQMIYVSDETGGATPAFSDGTNWRRVSDRAIVA